MSIMDEVMSVTAIDLVEASKRKCKRQRDNWKARALIYRDALEEIQSLSNQYNVQECEIASEAIARAEKVGVE